MKEAIGGVSLFQIFFAFILIFTGIMCLTINHSKAFAVKDEVINIIESQSVNTDNFKSEVLKKIKDYFVQTGHRVTGDCTRNREGYEGYDYSGNRNDTRAVICLKENNITSSFSNQTKAACSNNNCHPVDSEYPNLSYYDVIVFYQLDIPLVSSAFNLTLNGTTKLIIGGK